MTTNTNPTVGVAAMIDGRDNGYPVTAPASAYVVAGNAFLQSSGTAIAFDRSRMYGTVATPETGNITIDMTKPYYTGLAQLIIHNAGAEPTYGGMTKISGTYTINVANYIMLLAVSPTLVLVSINQAI